MIPTFALISLPDKRRLPELPLPLFLLWPLVPLSFALAWLMRRHAPQKAEALRVATHMCCQLQGLTVDIESSDKERVLVRFA